MYNTNELRLIFNQQQTIMNNMKENAITLNEVSKISNELGKVYTLLNKKIISHDREVAELVYPKLEGKMNPTAYADTMSLRDELYALRNACDMAMATLNRTLEIED